MLYESVIWNKSSTLTRLLLVFLKFLSNNFSLARWFRRSLAASSLEDYLLVSLEGDEWAKDYRRSTCDSSSFFPTKSFKENRWIPFLKSVRGNLWKRNICCNWVQTYFSYCFVKWTKCFVYVFHLLARCWCIILQWVCCTVMFLFAKRIVSLYHVCLKSSSHWRVLSWLLKLCHVSVRQTYRNDSI